MYRTCYRLMVPVTLEYRWSINTCISDNITKNRSTEGCSNLKVGKQFQDTGFNIRAELSWIWLFNVTFNDISVIYMYVTEHRCAGGMKKKLNLQSGSERHRHFVGFFNVSVQAPTRDHPFYGLWLLCPKKLMFVILLTKMKLIKLIPTPINHHHTFLYSNIKSPAGSKLATSRITNWCLRPLSLLLWWNCVYQVLHNNI